MVQGKLGVPVLGSVEQSKHRRASPLLHIELDRVGSAMAPQFRYMLLDKTTVLLPVGNSVYLEPEREREKGGDMEREGY